MSSFFDATQISSSTILLWKLKHIYNSPFFVSLVCLGPEYTFINSIELSTTIYRFE